MNRTRKLVALARVALIRRDAALQLVKLARAAEAAARADLAALNAAQRAAASSASGDATAARQFALYSRWVGAQRNAGEAALSKARQHSETCRAEAQCALGRTEVLVGLAKRLAAQRAAQKARRI